MLLSASRSRVTCDLLLLEPCNWIWSPSRKIVLVDESNASAQQWTKKNGGESNALVCLRMH